MTGAAGTAFFVNTPAVAQLDALTRSATSVAPSALSPACAAAAVKPCAEVTDPSGIDSMVMLIVRSRYAPPDACKTTDRFVSLDNLPGGPVRCRNRSSDPTNTTKALI